MGPITFLHPGLLAGAAAALVPIVLHLWQRRRPRRVPFSDLRFLEAGHARRARRLGLRQWLLLLLRVLAILCVTVAAARPRLAGPAPAPGGAVSLLLILDASASMQTQEEGGTRFTRAAQRGAELAAALPAGSEVQALLAGPTAVPLLAAWSPAGAPVGAALAAAAPTDGALDLAGALREAVRWCETARHRPATVVLVSDLQRSTAWPDSAALAPLGRAFAAPDGPALLLQRIGEPSPNGGVLAVAPPARAVRPGETVVLAAEVRGDGPREPFLLEIDGQRVAEALPAAGAGGLGRVEFTLTAPAPGWHRGRVSKRSDRLPADDDFPFVLRVHDRLAVLLAHGADRGEPAGRGGWRFLARALDPGPANGDAARDGGPLFAVRDLPADRVTEGDLAAADVLLLVDPEPPGRARRAELQAWLARGGGAALFLGDPTLAEAWTGEPLAGLGLPPALAWTARPDGSGERSRLLDPEHPLFRGLEAEPLATLREVRWQRWFTVADDSLPAPWALAGGAPLLLEARPGGGLAALFPFHLQLAATDLPLSPMFLPLAQRLAAWLAGRGAGEPGVAVGTAPGLRPDRRAVAAGALADASALRVSLPVPAGGPAGAGAGQAGGADQVGRAELAGRAAAPARLEWRAGAPWLDGPASPYRGFYVFTAGRDTLGLVAAATPAAEGDPRLWETAELRARLGAAGLPARDLGGGAAGGTAGGLVGRELTALFLALALGLLLAELALGRGDAAPEPAA